MSSVVVVGSVNTDLLVRVPTLPAPGETVLALDATSAAGGKGQAQAIAAARFGAATRFISIVGDDAEGRDAVAGLQREGVDTALVRTSTSGTGRAIVATDAAGENSIIVISGANAELESLTEADETAITAADVVLMQLENGTNIAIEAITCAHQAGVTTVLNAAPPPELLPHGLFELIRHVDYLVVNETECLRLAGGRDLESSAYSLARFASAVIVTLGARGGALYRGANEPVSLPAIDVSAVDTTGAGDSFCGVFAAAIAEGQSAESALRLGLIAGSLATLTPGNVPAIPTRDQVMAAAERP